MFFSFFFAQPVPDSLEPGTIRGAHPRGPRGIGLSGFQPTKNTWHTWQEPHGGSAQDPFGSWELDNFALRNVDEKRGAGSWNSLFWSTSQKKRQASQHEVCEEGRR